MIHKKSNQGPTENLTTFHILKFNLTTLSLTTLFNKSFVTFKKSKINILLITIILCTSLFWRFANYENRWTLSQDQARDAIIGLHMIEQKSLPLIGPPSSAGNFSFGPYYYWLIALFTILIPTINGPWLGFTLLSVFTPIIFYLIGKQYFNKIAATIFALIASFCSEYIFHSSDLLNPITIAFLVSLILLMLIKIADQQKMVYSFLLGLLIGIAINFHFQALGLIAIIPLLSIFNHFSLLQKLKSFGLSAIGFIVAFFPLIIFNITHQNNLFKNIITFLINNENRTGTSNNLIYDILIFWPQLWGTTLAHLPVLGYIMILLLLIAIVFALGDKKNFTKSFYIITCTFICQILFLFIYQGVRSPIYLIIFHGFFIYLTGWIMLNFYHFNKYLGLTIITIIVLISIPANFSILKNNNSQIEKIQTIKQTVDQKIMTPVTILTDNNSYMISLPLFYLYLKEEKIATNAKTKLIVCENKLIKESNGITEKWSCPMDLPTIAESTPYKIYDHNNLTQEQQKQFSVSPLKQEEIYHWLTSK